MKTQIDRIREMLWQSIDGYATAKAADLPSADAWRRVAGQALSELEDAVIKETEHAAIMSAIDKGDGNA